MENWNVPREANNKTTTTLVHGSQSNEATAAVVGQGISASQGIYSHTLQVDYLPFLGIPGGYFHNSVHLFYHI
jgi:hypothetical protein